MNKDEIVAETGIRHKSNPFINKLKVRGYSERYIKFQGNNAWMTIGLSVSGYKTLMMILWQLQTQSNPIDQVFINSATLREFNEYTYKHGKTSVISDASMRKGIKDLINAEVISKPDNAHSGEYLFNQKLIKIGERKLTKEDINNMSVLVEYQV